MGKPSFSDEFKRDAVVQITERVHSLRVEAPGRAGDLLPAVAVS